MTGIGTPRVAAQEHHWDAELADRSLPDAKHARNIHDRCPAGPIAMGKKHVELPLAATWGELADQYGDGLRLTCALTWLDLRNDSLHTLRFRLGRPRVIIKPLVRIAATRISSMSPSKCFKRKPTTTRKRILIIPLKKFWKDPNSFCAASHQVAQTRLAVQVGKGLLSARQGAVRLGRESGTRRNHILFEDLRWASERPTPIRKEFNQSSTLIGRLALMQWPLIAASRRSIWTATDFDRTLDHERFNLERSWFRSLCFVG